MPIYSKGDKCQEKAFSKLAEYSNTFNQGFIMIVDHPTCVLNRGTSTLQDKVHLELESWGRAAQLDTQILSSEDTNEADIARVTTNGFLREVTANNKNLPKLSMPFQCFNEKDCRSYLCPAIKRDLIQNGRKPVQSIKWGNENCKPSFWPDHMILWEFMSNPAHPMVNPHKMNGHKLVDILRTAVSCYLEKQGLSVKDHVVEEYNKKKFELRKAFNKDSLLMKISILDHFLST